MSQEELDVIFEKSDDVEQTSSQENEKRERVIAVLGNSDLLIASYDGNLEKVQLLLDGGVDVNQQDGNNLKLSALMVASGKGHTKIVELFLEKGADVNLAGFSGLTSMMLVAFHGYTEVAKMLLEKGCNVDVQDKEGYSPLMLASHSGHAELASLLLEKNAPIETRNVEGETSLMVASLNGHVEIVKLLLEKGAEVDAQCNREWSALIFAASEGHIEVAKILLESGAQVNIQDKQGYFPLLYAVKYGYKDLSHFLLDKGADVRLKTKKGKTLFDVLSSIKDVVTKPLYHELLETYLTDTHACLHSDYRHPGILFFKEAYKERVTSSEMTIFPDLEENGMSIHIPQDALSPSEEELELIIRPCFSGPFRLDKGYGSISPAYLIEPSRPVTFQKDVTVIIRHYGVLRSNADSDEAAFLSASTTPEFGASGAFYRFRKIEGVKGTFDPDGREGEVKLRNLTMLKIGRKSSRYCSSEEDEESSSKESEESVEGARGGEKREREAEGAGEVVGESECKKTKGD